MNPSPWRSKEGYSLSRRWQAAGLASDDENATDAAALNTCMSINAASIAWAAQAAPAHVAKRFAALGEPLVAVGDVEAPIGLTGPTWIATPLKYERDAVCPRAAILSKGER